MFLPWMLYFFQVIVKSGVQGVDQAAIWSVVVTSIPSLNVAPV
jgi:hypothetical protein